MAVLKSYYVRRPHAGATAFLRKGFRGTQAMAAACHASSAKPRLPLTLPPLFLKAFKGAIWEP